jgi:hypothetical protein
VFRYCLPIIAGLMLVVGARAQGPVKYNWKKGQVLVYKVEQITTSTDEVAEAKEETKTKLNLTKHWQVVDVDSEGVATMELSLSSMRNETTTPKGDVLLFDSANLDKTPEELRKVVEGFLNKTLAIIRIDRSGRVVEVKQAKQGGANTYEANPPFVAVVPQQPVQAGQFWDRDYNITLDPPKGTGEKFPAVQRYTCKQSTPTSVVLQIVTTLKKEPEAVADRVPLLQSLPEGEVDFDPQSGIMRSAHMKIDREVKGHQGEGSVYRLQSTYKEEYAGDK